MSDDTDTPDSTHRRFHSRLRKLCFTRIWCTNANGNAYTCACVRTIEGNVAPEKEHHTSVQRHCQRALLRTFTFHFTAKLIRLTSA